MALEYAEAVSMSFEPHFIAPHQRERRWAVRKPMAAPATIISRELPVPILCIMRDVSTTGAKLEIKESQDNFLGPRIRLPAYFTLVIRSDRMEVDCAAVWRKQAEIGVRFLAAPRSLMRAVKI